jgi:hypothetical protein
VVPNAVSLTGQGNTFSLCYCLLLGIDSRRLSFGHGPWSMVHGATFLVGRKSAPRLPNLLRRPIYIPLVFGLGSDVFHLMLLILRTLGVPSFVSTW